MTMRIGTSESAWSSVIFYLFFLNEEHSQVHFLGKSFKSL
jgi:hypothetical protein